MAAEGIELSEIELREKSRQLEGLVPIEVRALPDGFDSKTAYLALENGRNRMDGRVVRFVNSIQEERTKNKDYIPNSLHSTFVSNVEIYKTDGSLSRSTTSVGEREKSVGFDKIVAKFLAACKGTCMSAEQEDLLEMMTADLCACVMKYEGVTMQEALHTVYVSQLYKKMQNPKTLLYRESGHYLYDMLCEERGIKKAHMKDCKK